MFAVGTEEQNTTDNTEISEKAEETKPYILFEDEEKRTETEKHFKMSDGSYTVADYGTPIHFKQQNQWIDYDNNMNSFEENEEKIEKQSLQNNFNSIIDNKINESINVDKSEDNKYFKSIKTDTDIMLSKKSKHNNMIKMEKDGYKISWGFQNIKRKNIEFTNIQENYATKDEKYLNLKNSKKEAFYKDVFDNVDLQYFVLPKKIKENIIIKNANAQNEFLINYSIDKLTPIQKDDKTIELIDENEKVIYTIFAPIMTDAKGESSQNVTLSIFSVKNKKMVVKLAFDKAWITDENRVFPINVDPIIETEQASEKIKYTYSNNLSPNTSWNHDYYLYIGNNSQGKCRSYVNIALPQLPASSVITNANLSLYYFNDGYSYDPGTTTKSPKIEVREIGQDKNLSMSQITWNNQPDANFNNPVLDYKNLYASSDQWFTFDVTKSINKWYSNSPGENHKGFMLKSSEENDSRRIRLLSSNTSITNKAYPIITINYLDSTGIESYGSYHEQSEGRAGTGYINDLTGNLTFTAPVVQTPGTIMPANLSFVYNGYNSDKYFNNNVGWILLNGAGWQISATRFVENVNMS
ncbi:MAG: DNRLRE domain-containing protein, partial [Oscillospiraceae bacterium]